MTQACHTPSLKQLTFADFTRVIQMPASTPKKKGKTVDKPQAAAKDYDCSKGAAMKCCCCIHTNGKATWFPTCPRTLRVGEVLPKVQDAYGKATTRELAKDVAKYSCKYWERGLTESCYTCGHHAHTDVLEKSCPQLKGIYRDGEEADKLLINSRRARCPTWISKADAMKAAAERFNSPEEVRRQEEIDRSEKSIAQIVERQRAEHPDWVWELWKIEPHAASHPNAGQDYEWLWEIFPTKPAAGGYLKTMLRIEGKNSKRQWEIRERAAR